MYSLHFRSRKIRFHFFRFEGSGTTIRGGMKLWLRLFFGPYLAFTRLPAAFPLPFLPGLLRMGRRLRPALPELTAKNHRIAEHLGKPMLEKSTHGLGACFDWDGATAEAGAIVARPALRAPRKGNHA
jgi:hypothetical protein